MSYLVLARKYRPTSFDDIAGQEHVVRTLKNAIALDRVHHAFLFTGARGVGKTTTARVLARALNCAQGPTPDPCGVCPACVEIGSGASPDVLEIDGASNTGVDNVRELRETVRYLPSRGRTKLYIIDEVHMLSQAAFNALLKTLEEPPPHVKFIFATTEPQKIPITILSRCQRFDFRRIGIARLSQQLREVAGKEGVTLGPASVTAIAREAQGSARDALSLLDQVLSFAGTQPTDAQVVEALGVVDRETLFALAGAILERHGPTLLDLLAEIDARGHDPADLAGLLVEHLRDLMVVKVVEKPSEAILDRSPGELEALRAQGEKVGSAELHRMFALLVSVAEDVARSAFPKVSLEMGLLRLLEVEPAQNLATLLGRLDDLVTGSGPVSAKAAPRASASGGAEAAGRGAAGSAATARPTPSLTTPSLTTPSLTTPSLTTPAATPSAAPPATTSPPTSTRPPWTAPTSTPRVSPQATAAPTVSTPAASGSASAEATPSPARAASASPDSAAGPAAQGVAWSAVVARVREMRPALASVLDHARLVSFAAEGVEVGVPRGFYWDALADPEQRQLLQRAIDEEFARSVPLRLRPVDGVEGGASLAEEQARAHQERVAQIQDAAHRDPVVRSTAQILGGELKEVIPLIETSE